MANTTYASSSTSIKVATLALIVVLVLHIIGFSVPRWCTVEFTLFSSNVKGESGYHAGLWQHCGCTEVFGSGVCFCLSRSNDPTWMKIVQGLETLALVGFTISLMISVMLICYKQKKKYKQVNFFVVVISGALGIIGTVIFGVKTTDNFKALNSYSSLASIEELKIGNGHFSYAFFLCVSSSCICLLICATLFMKDICSASPVPTQEVSVHYTPQSHGPIYNPQQGPQGHWQYGQQQAGTVPQYTHAENVYPPPYEPQFQPQNSGIPYKS